MERMTRTEEVMPRTVPIKPSERLMVMTRSFIAFYPKRVLLKLCLPYWGKL